MPNLRQVVLVILDGWGIDPKQEHNAIHLAPTPCFDRLWNEYPHTTINASEEYVGLPVGQMGNSEIGHMTMGAGRVLAADLVRISKAIKGKTWDNQPALTTLFDHVINNDSVLHVIGLVSPGGVHSHQDHLHAFLKTAKERGIKKVVIHAVTDGRDMPPQSAHEFLEMLEQEIEHIGLGIIATVTGRFYAMDRDHRWERVQAAYSALTHNVTQRAASALAAVEAYYASPSDASRTGDEFILPTAIGDTDAVARSRIKSGDAVLFFNFRGDRPREITKAFVLEDDAWSAMPHGGFDRGSKLDKLFFATLAQYETGLPVEVVFARPSKLPSILGDWLSTHGIAQFRCAETEKFPHVTFFFNDYREEPFPGEQRVIVPSPKDIPTYDLKPEMSAAGVRDAVLARLAAPDCENLIVVNFANPDMVGHTGSLPAAIKACEVVDACVQTIVDATLARGGELIITADHGNAEQMKDPVTGAPHTAHTNFTVPLTVVGARWKGAHLREGGRLGEVAPTLLKMLGMGVPAPMTGVSLL
jgi:2,3-bisphosphoglycerate-independent phosphoglycerate mutase